MASRNIHRQIINSKLLKNYGSWLYCNSCNKTVAYFCYTTYKSIDFSYVCKCGNNGKISLIEDGYVDNIENKKGNKLLLVNNRLCCKNDKDPILSIINKQIMSFEYQITCKKCNETYVEKA